MKSIVLTAAIFRAILITAMISYSTMNHGAYEGTMLHTSNNYY